MADRTRRGMLITNNGADTVHVSLAARQLRIDPGQKALISPEEVQAPTLRHALQERSIAIVRPATPEEEEQLQKRLGNQ